MDRYWQCLEEQLPKTQERDCCPFRLNSGHDCMAAHLHKTHIFEIEEHISCEPSGFKTFYVVQNIPMIYKKPTT